MNGGLRNKQSAFKVPHFKGNELSESLENCGNGKRRPWNPNIRMKLWWLWNIVQITVVDYIIICEDHSRIGSTSIWLSTKNTWLCNKRHFNLTFYELFVFMRPLTYGGVLVVVRIMCRTGIYVPKPFRWHRVLVKVQHAYLKNKLGWQASKNAP